MEGARGQGGQRGHHHEGCCVLLIRGERGCMCVAVGRYSFATEGNDIKTGVGEGGDT